MTTGPVQYAVIRFPGNQFSGEIAPALAELVESGLIRIIDLVFVLKDAEGNVQGFEVSDVEPEVAEAWKGAGGTSGGLVNEEDVGLAAENLEPDTSAALLVWEDVWAARMVSAVRGASGEVIERGLIPADAVA